MVLDLCKSVLADYGFCFFRCVTPGSVDNYVPNGSPWPEQKRYPYVLENQRMVSSRLPHWNVLVSFREFSMPFANSKFAFRNGRRFAGLPTCNICLPKGACLSLYLDDPPQFSSTTCFHIFFGSTPMHMGCVSPENHQVVPDLAHSQRT